MTISRAHHPIFLALGLLLAASLPAGAQRIEGMPQDLGGIGVTQKLGDTLPLDALFQDEEGRSVRLGDLLQARPTILALVYYDCPMLCNMVLDGVAKAVMPITLEQGEDFDIVAVSFAPEETPEMARRAKEHLFERYRTERQGWNFLTGEEEAIRRLTEAVGFSYRWIEENGEYAHTAAIAVVSPQGTLTRYFYGIDYPPRDLRLALVEASEERIGTLADQILLYCYRYDPATGQYTFAVWAALRVAGVLLTLGFLIFLVVSLRRERQTNTVTAH